MTSTRYKWHSCSKDDFPFKRQKVPKACQLCRQKKMRCDGLNPCGRCSHHKLKCGYDEQSRRQSLHQVKDDISNSDAVNHTSTKYEYSEGNEHHHQQQQRQPTNGTAVPPPSPSPSPSPLQQQPETQNHNRYSRANLSRISFANNVYESMRRCRCTNATTRSYLFATQTPPLMFDFFNLTSQPYRIWSVFITRFTDFLQRPQPDKSNELAHEIVDLFAKFNLLYSPFFDFAPLTCHITPGLLMKDPAPDTIESIVLYAIFALVLHAAFQTLSTSYQELAESLEEYASIFYQEAQQRFLKMAFGPPRDLDRVSLIHLVRVAILLTHYNCTAVSEESAYMTLRIGMGYAIRSSLPTMVKGMSGRGSRSVSSAVACIDAAERKRLLSLYKVLIAWHTWLSFYLHREDWMAEDVALKSEMSISSGITPSTLKTMMDDKSSSDKHAQQRWAIHATEAYTEFLQDISRAPPNLVDIQRQLQILQTLSIPPSEKTTDKKEEMLLTTPACILSLYHHTLTIQLFFCQVAESQDFFLHGEQLLAGNQTAPSDSELPDNNLMLALCDSAAAEIVHIVDLLTVNHHTSVSDYKGTGGLVATTTGSSRQRDPIAHAVLYPICLAATISVLCLRLRQPSSNEKNSDRDVPQESPNLSTAKSTLPIFKLQRLLNPISSQMELANMISQPLDEIQAKSKSSSSASSELQVATSTTAVVVAEDRPVATDPFTHVTATPTGTLHHHQHNQQYQQLQRQQGMRPPPVEQFWADSGFDHSLQEEQVFFTETAMPSRGMVHPSLHFMNRNDIDREQLSKLTSKKDLTATTATMATMATHSSSIDMCNMYSARKQRMTQAGVMHYQQGQKRRRYQQQQQHHHHHHQQQQQQEEEMDSVMIQHAPKKMPTTYDSFMRMNLMGTPRQVSYSHQHHTMNNGGSGGSNGRSSSNNIPAELQNTMNYSVIPDEYFIYEQMKMSGTPPTPELLFTNNFTATTTPRLPPPKQQRHQGVTNKNWAGREKETEAFHGSMMETLHTSTIAPGTITVMDTILMPQNPAGGNNGSSSGHGHPPPHHHPGPGGEQPSTMSDDTNMFLFNLVENEANRMGWDDSTVTKKRTSRVHRGLRPAAAAAVTARSAEMYGQDPWLGM